MKTLKDIEFVSDDFGHSCYPHINEIDDVVCKKLREEAMKWYHRSDGNKHKFIREFFNLTEKDISDIKSEEVKNGK